MKQLLTETLITQWETVPLTEAKGIYEGKYIVKGIVQRYDAINQNKRRYPKEILMPSVERYINEFVKQNRALGELDHPNSEVVNLSNASHNILELKWDGSDLVGVIEILNTPPGLILKELFKHNIRVGISSRGMGSVREIDEGDTVEVQSDYEIVCWDFVSNPSTHGAFMRPMNEGKTSQVEDPNSGIWELTNSIICDLPGTFCECKIKPKK